VVLSPPNYAYSLHPFSMHEVEALIAKSDKLAAGARQFESAIVCPLVQGLSLLQITEAFAKELGGYQTT
jgi:hypothetical protein